MKRIILLAALLAPALASAEVKAGTLELAGNLGGSYSAGSTTQTGQQDTDTTTVQLRADGLYYPIDRFGIGLSAQVNNLKATQGSAELSSNTFAFGPAVGFDFPIEDRVSLFVQGTLSYASMESQSTTFRGLLAAATAGAKWFPVPSVSLNAGVTLSHQGVEHSSTTVESNVIGFGIGASVYFAGG